MRSAILLSCTVAIACGAAPPVGGPPDLVGEVTRQRIEAEVPGWREQAAATAIDSDAARSLAAAPPDAELRIYFGSWCSDSQREITRLFRIEDEIGTIPATVRLIAVDRDKDEPAALLAGVDLEYVPTFVVIRDGVEVGRIVESAPNGLERDLDSLLRGDQTGVITGRD